MKRKAKAKVAVAALAVLALPAWIVLMDFGINAGRIHYGVNVEGIDVGGMTFDEAVETLESKAERLQEEPVVLSAEGMECSFLPEDDLGWTAKPKKTTEKARSVGFDGGVLTALGDRLAAWFAGVDVEWARAIDRAQVRSLIDDCEEQAEALGLELDRAKLRGLIARSIVTWPRGIFEIPVSAAG